jgi:hypothetical protein
MAAIRRGVTFERMRLRDSRPVIRYRILNFLQDVAKHPAFLLVLGFLMTGFVGSWLDSRWHESEWKNQQIYLAKQQDLQRKNELIGNLMESTATYLAASRDVIAMAQWEFDPKTRKDDIAGRIASWEKARRTWQVESVVIYNKVGIYFPEEPKSQRIFQCITYDVDFMGPDLRSLIEAKITPDKESGEEEDLIKPPLDRMATIERELDRLGALLRREVQKTASGIAKGGIGRAEGPPDAEDSAGCLKIISVFKEEAQVTTNKSSSGPTLFKKSEGRRQGAISQP